MNKSDEIILGLIAATAIASFVIGMLTCQHLASHTKKSIEQSIKHNCMYYSKSGDLLWIDDNTTLIKNNH